MVRVVIPHNLRELAGVSREVELAVDGPVTTDAILSALELAYPVLKGTVREHGSFKRRAFVRYFAAGEDISFAPTDQVLPASIAEGREPFMVIGAIAGG